MLLWIIAKLLIHFLFAIIWEMKNMLFYMLLFHIFKQWGMSEYTSLQANVDNTIKYPITITEVYCLIPFLKHGWKERAFAGTSFYINDLFNSYFKMAVTKEITANSWFYWVIIGL